MSVLKAFRLPEEIVTVLSNLAKETNRSEKFFVVEALKLYLGEFMDGQIAKDRFNDPKSKIISAKEMRKRLGL